MRIALYFDLPGATYSEAAEHVAKMIESMVNPTDADVEVNAYYSPKGSPNHLPNMPLLPQRMVLECEDNRLQREKNCRTLCENAGWTMRDGQVFNAIHHANLQSALDHPDATVYDSWAECCKGEGLTDDLTADLGITEPGEKENPVGLWSQHAEAMAHKLRGSTAAEAESIKTQTGIVTRSDNIQAGGGGTSSHVSFSGPAGWGGGGKASGGMAGAGSAEAPRLVPRIEAERVTAYPGEAVPEGYTIAFSHTKAGWFFYKPNASRGGMYYATKEAAIEEAQLDPIGGRGEEPEQPEPRDPETVLKTAINEALDHLMADIPDWRKKFHPFASTKGKRALEDLVGLVASIRTELKSETSTNVTNVTN